MIVNHIEVRLATISFEERIIRYLAESYCLPYPNREEVSCFFCVPSSSTLALIIRCTEYEKLLKKKKSYSLTLHSSHTGTITKEFILSGTDFEFGHIMAANANKTGLPSTNLDEKWLSSLGEQGKNSMKLTVRAGKDGFVLAIFNLSIKRTANQDAISFSADSPLRFAPHIGSSKISNTFQQHKHSREKDSDEDDESSLAQQIPKKGKHIEGREKTQSLSVNAVPDTLAGRSSQVQIAAPTSVVKAEPDEVHHAKSSQRSIDRSTPLELIMQQEQREKFYLIEDEIERITNEYEKEKEKIHSKIRKLEKSRNDKKQEFKQSLHNLRKAKEEAKEKLDWIISNTAPIEIETSDDDQSGTDREGVVTKENEIPLVISDSDNDESDTSENESEGEDNSDRKRSSKKELKVRSQKLECVF